MLLQVILKNRFEYAKKALNMLNIDNPGLQNLIFLYLYFSGRLYQDPSSGHIQNKNMDILTIEETSSIIFLFEPKKRNTESLFGSFGDTKSSLITVLQT